MKIEAIVVILSCIADALRDAGTIKILSAPEWYLTKALSFYLPLGFILLQNNWFEWDWRSALDLLLLFAIFIALWRAVYWFMTKPDVDNKE